MQLTIKIIKLKTQTEQAIEDVDKANNLDTVDKDKTDEAQTANKL